MSLRIVLAHEVHDAYTIHPQPGVWLQRPDNDMPQVTTVFSAWCVLLLAGVLEIVFSVALKLADGFSRFTPGVVAVVAGISSVWLVSLTLRVLPVGTAYAVWAGIGAAGTLFVGILFLGEPASVARMACVAAIVAGIVGLQLTSAG